MKKEDRRERLGLILLIAALAFAVQLITVLIAAALVSILMYTGVIRDLSAESITPGNTLLLMSAISIFAGILLSAFTGKYLLQPVNRFINQMNRLADGDFKARIHFGKPISAHPSFQEIERSFNKAAEELEQTEVLRGDFINNFSHEFKTPIVSIAGFAKLLRRGNLTPEQQEEYLAVIEEESLRLAQMATSVLDLTKIENQTILTNVSRFNVSEQVRSAILLLEEKWTKKNLEFNFRIGEFEICANEELLKHVWINLLDNAVKFSEEYGYIDILVEEKDGKIAVAISNTGKPIPPESMKRIFNKFYQADESHSSQGSGIGLAIVKKVVELHQGTVSVQSSPDLTTFTVELPKG
ncbi:MAG: ATP-binding protein [Faecousia sp.]